MLAVSLGVAWLLLAPLSLWLLVKGTNRERAGAVVTLALLECATFTMDSALHPSTPFRPAVAHALPAAPRACEAGFPVPRSARAGKDLVLTWAAGPRECGTAEAAVRTQGRKVLVWLREDPRLDARRPAHAPGHKHVFTLPVRVEDGEATLTVPFHVKPGYIPVDGRTGRRIPAPASTSR
ncbi:hypothetical protein [Nonomuraea zeae]|uniref:Uncharacterized protein n=1 Tax=Nonomuraea zeae TaxID=1642303 RepID=A0A5S4GXT9_9ACTN|nr:hypothetical protein [Nonomuraea zeae]TMR37778.1 hypothetical protein ETD85_07145 [Nonomuraea zeae]